MPTKSGVALGDVRAAAERLRPHLEPTPLLLSEPLSDRCGAQVYLKLENLQPTGSFKIRGVTSKLTSLEPEEMARGVVTASTGNHGRAVAYGARALGIPATVCVARGVPQGKLAAIEALGGEVVTGAATFDEAVDRSLELRDNRGLVYVHAFDDPQVIAGQGTIGLELLDELPDLQTVIIPLSGGGLLGGITTAVKALRPSIQVIGVSMEAGPVMVRSIEAGAPVTLPEEPTLADALVGGLGPENLNSFQLVRANMDRAVLVSEAEIGQAMAFAADEHRLVVEGAGAVGLAALLSGRVELEGGMAAVIVSGGNVDLPVLTEIARAHTKELNGSTQREFPRGRG